MMKSKFGREIALLCLPFLVIVVAAMWKSHAPAPIVIPPPVMIPRLMVAPMLPPSLVPSSLPVPVSQVRLGAVNLSRMGPVCSQNAWFDGDAQVAATLLVPSGPWLKPVAATPLPARPSAAMPPRMGAPSFPGSTTFSTGSGTTTIITSVPCAVLGLKRATWEFRDQSGAAVPPPAGAQSGAGPTILMDSRFSSPLQIQSTATSATTATSAASSASSLGLINQRFDLDRVSASLGAIRLQGSLVFNGGAVNVGIPVRPAWFTRAPRTLKLISAKWRAPEAGDEGSIEIALLSSAKPPLLLTPEPRGSAIAWQIAPAAPGVAGREVFSQRKLLYNWSPRLESADGQYNSHAAKDIKVWASYRQAYATPQTASQTAPVSPTQIALANFWPKIWAQNPVQRGGLIYLRFRCYGLESQAQAQVFKTEIGVPGDGFLKISVPLPTEGDR